jgi:hypothetical protein
MMVVPALAFTTGAGAAKGGNSANAKACQKGGWENWVRADQTPFANQDECVSYGAKGGTLTEPTPAPTSYKVSVTATGGSVLMDVGFILGSLGSCNSDCSLDFSPGTDIPRIALIADPSPQFQYSCNGGSIQTSGFIGSPFPIQFGECPPPGPLNSDYHITVTFPT